MSVRRIHFQRIPSHPRMIVRPLCERANVLCNNLNASPARHEVTCKRCLRRMSETATWARECAAIKADIQQEMA